MGKRGEEVLHQPARMNGGPGECESTMERTRREKKPNRKVECVGAVLAFLMYFLIIFVYGLSTSPLAMGAGFITLNGFLYWSRRKTYYLWTVVVAVVSCILYLVFLPHFQ